MWSADELFHIANSGALLKASKLKQAALEGKSLPLVKVIGLEHREAETCSF